MFCSLAADGEMLSRRDPARLKKGRGEPSLVAIGLKWSWQGLSILLGRRHESARSARDGPRTATRSKVPSNVAVSPAWTAGVVPFG